MKAEPADLQSAPFDRFGTYPEFFPSEPLGFRTWFHYYAFDDDFFQGKVVLIGVFTADLFEIFQTFEDATEDGVFSIEVREGLEAEIELAAIGDACGIDRTVDARHGDGTLFVRQTNFGRNSVAGATRSRFVGGPALAVGIARLEQGARKSPVETHAIVVAAGHQVFQVFDVEWGGLVVKSDNDPSEVPLLADLDGDHRHLGAE